MGARERMERWKETDCLVLTRDDLREEERTWVCGQAGLWEVRARINRRGAGTLFASWPTWGTDGRRVMWGESPVLDLSWDCPGGREMEDLELAKGRRRGYTKPAEKKKPREEQFQARREVMRSGVHSLAVAWVWQMGGRKRG